MPEDLLKKTIHFFHVPHHCSRMTLKPLQRRDYKQGICAVITSYNRKGAREKAHDAALRRKYGAVYYITERISNTSGALQDSFAKRIQRPFDAVIER